MKLRKILYGYRYVNGAISVDKAEAEVVQEIFKDYTEGKSLLKIADSLTHRGIEYMPGVTAWNKNKIKRIIEDQRYLGKGEYPKLIEETEFEIAQQAKVNRNTQTGIDRAIGIYQMKKEVLCPTCGAKMKRYSDRKQKVRQRWKCTDKNCKTSIPKSDEDMLSEITSIMNRLINDPEIIVSRAEEKPSLEILKAENDISRELQSTTSDKTSLREKILDCASMKFGYLSEEKIISQRLRDIFKNQKQLKDFSHELFNRVADKVLIQSDGKILLQLTNGQRVGEANEKS